MDSLLAFELSSNAANRVNRDSYAIIKPKLSIARDGETWFIVHLGMVYENLTKEDAINRAMLILVSNY